MSLKMNPSRDKETLETCRVLCSLAQHIFLAA